MDKYKLMSLLRKTYPTQMQEHYLEVGEYLEKLKTVDDRLALEMASRYLANLQIKKKK